MMKMNGNEKFYEQLIIRLSMSLAESLSFFLLYILLSRLDNNPKESTIFIFVGVAIFFSLLNILLKRFSGRRIYSLLLNLLPAFLLYLLVTNMLTDKLILFVLLVMLFRIVFVAFASTDKLYFHFDLLMALSFILILIFDIMAYDLKYGVFIIVAIFFFNLFPLYIASRADEQNNSFFPGFSLILLVLFAISASGLVLLPKAVGLATMAYRHLGNITNRFLNVLEKIFLRLANRSVNSGSGVSSSDGSLQTDMTEIIPPSQGGQLADQIMKVFLVIASLGILLLILMLVFYLIRKLFSFLFKKQFVASADFSFNFKAAFLHLMDSFVNLLKDSFSLGASADVFDVYTKFLKWGSKKGIPRFNYETPFEYSRRISLQYDNLKNPVDTITELFTYYHYSGETPDSEINHQAKETFLMLRQAKTK